MLSSYDSGNRKFHRAILDGADFSGVSLEGARFYGASLRGASFRGASLTFVQFKGADLTGADFSGAGLNASDSIGANFCNASLRDADLTGTELASADCRGADLRNAWLNNSSLSDALLKGARLARARLSSCNLSGTDVSPLCDVRSLRFQSPSEIDAWTVMKSYKHPRLRNFMLDCGVPPLFVEYMIDCARAMGQSLIRSIMQSAFISYGGPDERFAHKLYEALKARNVSAFFFPETATLGERINNEVFRRLQEHDRVILVCSRESLARPGVLHEIQETFDREARDGGATYLLPIMLDDYVLTEWRDVHPDYAERIGRRVVGDFRGADRGRKKFEAALDRLVEALKKSKPV